MTKKVQSLPTTLSERDKAIARTLWRLIELVELVEHSALNLPTYSLDDCIRRLAPQDRRVALECLPDGVQLPLAIGIDPGPYALAMTVALAETRVTLGQAHAKQDHVVVLCELGRVALNTLLPKKFWRGTAHLARLATDIAELRKGRVEPLVRPQALYNAPPPSARQSRFKANVAVICEARRRLLGSKARAERDTADSLATIAAALGITGKRSKGNPSPAALTPGMVRDWHSEIMRPNNSKKPSQLLPVLVALHTEGAEYVLSSIIEQYEADCRRLPD